MGLTSRISETFKKVFRIPSLPKSRLESQPPESGGEAAKFGNGQQGSEVISQSTASVPTANEGRKSILGGYWLEWLVILLVLTVFCAGILDLRSLTRLPGNESEIFQSLDWTLVNSLKHFHAFPLWNIYLQTGLPYIADPMLHVYNPVVTLPVLLFGVRAGFKLGVYFSFLIAAFGMWRLAQVLGLGRAARLWMALMFAFAGQPVARFLQGQYLFVLGYAYIPWIVSSLYLITQRKRRLDVAMAAGSIALLFFSGNAYYPMYVLLIIGLFGIIMLLRINRRPPYFHIDLKTTFVFLGIGVLTVGIIAIQLLPTMEYWPRLGKDLNLAGSQSIQQIFLDYTSKDSYRPDAYSVLPAREEFYAYIGLTPFLALALLPLAIWKRDRKLLLFFGLIVVLTVVWICLEWMPWREAFLQTRIFIQFRHLLRILVLGSFALICLAGIGLDTLWKLLENELVPGVNHNSQAIRWLATAGLVVLGVFMAYGVGDIFTTNRFAVQSQEIYQPAYVVMSWVRQNDLGDYYIRHNPTNAWQDAVLSNNLRYLDSWYHFADIRSLDGKINQRYLKADPEYLIQSPAEPVPEGAQLLAVVADTNIYSLPESLPMAFLVDNSQLQLSGDAGPLLRSDVMQVTPFFSSPNKVEMITTGTDSQTLVLMMTRYPGWKVLADGKPQTLQNVMGYSAVSVQPGVHKYSFVFTPKLFFIGLVISMIALGTTVFLFVSDLRLDLQGVRDRWKNTVGQLGHMGKRLPAYKGKEWPLTGEAIYSQGALHPSQPLQLDENAPVRLTVEPQLGVSRGKAAWQHWKWATQDLAGTLWRAIPLDMALLAVALGLYLSTRLIGLANFPIYFFTDEAVQTVMAEDFVHNGLRNYENEPLPTYFSRGATYNLSSVSVYAQVIPYLIFGKSEVVTRAVSVLIGTLGALAVGLILRDFFKLRYWWCGVLLLSIAPAWFLHSRTAFETVEMSAFFAGFLYFYLRYRYISPKAVYPALVMGALVFYTYSPGQLIIVVMGIFLLFSDMRYHWQNRKTALKGLLLLLVLAVPYLRYTLAHPEALIQHLSTRAPYWSQNIPLFEKLRHYFSDYAYGLNPLYWFVPNEHDLQRHLMKGYGHLFLTTLPFFGLGLVIAIINLRSSAHRAILFALLAAPTGAALVGIGITRILVFVIPAVILMALGLETALHWLERGLKWLFTRRLEADLDQPIYTGVSLMLVLILGLTNILMLRDALINGPTWYQDYTLAGMQYGAPELFSAVNQYVSQHPDAELIVSPNWTNGTDAVAQFFLPPGTKVKLGSIVGYLFRHMALNEQTVFVMIPDEMAKVVSSNKFKDIQVDQVLNYPNGQPGFYFVRLKYVDNIDEILSAEQAVRSTLQQGLVSIDGEQVQVAYSMLDMGSIELVFDGDPHTLARTLEANPFIIELTFPEARSLSGYKMILGSADVRSTVLLFPASGEQAGESVADFDGSVSNPELDVNFGQPMMAQVVRFEIFQPYSGVPANVHLWEIELK